MNLTPICVFMIILPVFVRAQGSTEPCDEWLKKGNRCPGNTVCRLVQVHCIRAPCPPQPTCVRNTLEVSDCRYGHPVRDTSNRPLSCYTGRPCPDQTTCNTEVADAPSTCCWTPRIVRTHQTQTFDPCIATTCVVGQICEVQTPKTCFNPPCQPTGVCVVRTQHTQTFDPCIATTCVVGQICEVQTPKTCFNPPCQPTGVCVDPGRCRLTCPVGQECRLQEVTCVRAPCPPIAACVRRTSPSGQCPSGKPVVDANGNDIFCGRGGRRCPDETSCQIDPADRFAVCCDQKVIPPRPPTGTLVRKGTCPQPGVGICVNLCRYDNSCPGIQKCCSNGCGRTCQAPVGVTRPSQKAGRCPRPTPGVAGGCAELCSGDSDCPGTRKCCSNGCGHSCQAPAGLSKPDLCKNKRCRRTEVCRVIRGACNRAPCPIVPMATCVPRRQTQTRPRPTHRRNNNCPRSFGYRFNLFCNYFHRRCISNDDCNSGTVCCYSGVYCGSRCVRPRYKK